MILKLHNPQLIGTYVTDDTFELTTLCIQIHQMLANLKIFELSIESIQCHHQLSQTATESQTNYKKALP